MIYRRIAAIANVVLVLFFAAVIAKSPANQGGATVILVLLAAIPAGSAIEFFKMWNNRNDT